MGDTPNWLTHLTICSFPSGDNSPSLTVSWFPSSLTLSSQAPVALLEAHRSQLLFKASPKVLQPEGPGTTFDWQVTWRAWLASEVWVTRAPPIVLCFKTQQYSCGPSLLLQTKNFPSSAKIFVSIALAPGSNRRLCYLPALRHFLFFLLDLMWLARLHNPLYFVG